jgi:isoquinoline 1-oxidoreductase beta subunit
MEHINLTRRTWLKTSAAAGGGLVIGVYLPGASRIAEAAAGPTQLNAFVKIGTDGKVTFVTGTSEMGQGSHNALAMMIAEELEVDFKNMHIEQGGVDPAFGNPRWAGFKARGGFQYTTGSSAVRNVGVRVRYAGAAARFMLISAGAERMQVLRSECVADNGFVVHKPSGRKVSYGAIANDAAKMTAPDEPVLKQPSEFKIIGKRTPRHDTPPKVSGKAVFGIDVKVPNMLTATVVHCPVFGGKVASFDASRTKAVTGVRQVVQISSGIAVVADHFWAAKKGADALKITWDEGPYANLSSADIRRTFTALAKQPGKVRRNDGDANKALEQAPRKIEAVYEVPFLDPACMEPMNATAHWKGDSVEVWAPTQAQSNNQQGIMDLTGLPREKITLHTTYLGGGFGRRAYNDFVLEAVETSKAVGKPVKLIWTRAEDMQHSMYRPSTYNVLTAALAPDGMPLAWKHHIVGPSILSYLPSINHLLRDGMDATSVAGAADVFPYAIPNVFVDYVLHNPGVPVGFWRSVGNSQNGYIMESFIDELAHAAGKDPYQYRRQLLAKHPRFISVLDLAADKAGWGKPAPAGVHRGIATAYSYGSHVAQVAEVSVAKDGKVKVHRVVCAVDPGWVVNPDTFTAQMEGGILYGLSGALFGEITIKNGRVEQSNFHDYPLPRITDMPKIEVYFLKGEGEQGGAGEPGVPAAAPAVVNAIFAATGKRIRKLPIKPEMLRT